MAMRRLATCALCLLLLVSIWPPRAGSSSSPSVWPASAGVHLVSSDASGVTLLVAVPWEQLQLDPAGEYVRVSFPGWLTTSQPGAPALPMLAEAIGVPHGVTFDVRTEAGPAHCFQLTAPPLPNRSQFVEPGLPGGPTLPDVSTVLVEDASIYDGEAPYPAELGALTNDGLVRQQRVAGVSIYPVQYSPASGRLTVFEWLRVTVTFQSLPPATGGTPGAMAGSVLPAAAESPIYEDYLSSSLLNYASAREWRGQPVAPGPVGRDQIQGITASVPWTPPEPAWKIHVRTDGIYRVTDAELAAAGVPVDVLDRATLQLFFMGREVPLLMEEHPEGGFDLLFYGQAPRNKYSPDSVYWLTFGQAAGLRIGTREVPDQGQPTVSAYDATEHREINAAYITWLAGDDDMERWLWTHVYGPTVRPVWQDAFTLSAPLVATATLRIQLQGISSFQDFDPDHHAAISLNGSPLTDVTWDGQEAKSVEISVPGDLLSEGANILAVSAVNDTGATFDIFYIDWYELSYPRSLIAEGDSIVYTYSQPGNWAFQLDGFSSDRVAAYDITDPYAVSILSGCTLEPSTNGYLLTFRDEITTACTYLVGADSTYLNVASIEQDTPSQLGLSATGADYIVITHSQFSSQAMRLADLRSSQGLRAVVVDVQDIYDEFGFGMEGADPIRSFLACAYAQWPRPAPSLVVLMGDGHYDPKGYLNTGRGNFIPAYLAVVDPSIGETATDNRYITIVGQDTLPDMMIGRLAVNTGDEARAFVDKILAYEDSPEPGDWRTHVLAIADNEDPAAGNFPAFSDALLADALPSTYQAQRIYFGVTHPTVTGARQAIIAGLNGGAFLVNYIGHAASTQWADEGLFKTSDIAGLTNGPRMPIILAMSCSDGYFIYPPSGSQCTAEMITRAEGKGAIASWSPAGYGVATGHDYLDRGFFEAVFYDRDGHLILGQAVQSGQLRLWATHQNLDLVDTYTLFGDPATNLSVEPYRDLVYLPLVRR